MISKTIKKFKNKLENTFKKKPNFTINYVNNERLEINHNLSYVTDIGKRRKENQDSGLVEILGEWKLLIVADGVASTTGSKIASTCAVVKIRDYLKAKKLNIKNPEEDIRNAILFADSEIKKIKLKSEQINSDYNPPKTTLVMALIKDKTAYVAWVGDSRAYMINKRSVIQVSKDDSWVEEAMEKGMTLKDALSSNMAHAITQCMGMMNKDMNIHIKKIDITNFDLLLCSDGLWNYFNEGEKLLELYSNAYGRSIDRVNEMIGAVLKAGGGDNVTIALYCDYELPSIYKD